MCSSIYHDVSTQSKRVNRVARITIVALSSRTAGTTDRFAFGAVFLISQFTISCSQFTLWVHKIDDIVTKKTLKRTVTGVELYS